MPGGRFRQAGAGRQLQYVKRPGGRPGLGSRMGTEKRGYGQFCPAAVAAEVLAERWTPLVIRELLLGSTRFNDLRRGVPCMSSSLLAGAAVAAPSCLGAGRRSDD